MSLSSIGFADFSMPINLESDIIQIPKNSDAAKKNEDHCHFYFLNALFKTGRLLFYHIDDTQDGWRQAISSSMALLSDRISTIELIQKSIQVDLNDVLDKTNSQIQSIGKIHLSLNGIKKNYEDINKKVDNLKKDINNNIDKMQKSTNNELKNFIKLLTFNEKKMVDHVFAYYFNYVFYFSALRLIGKHKDRYNGPGSFYLTNNTYAKKAQIDNLALSYGGEDFLHVNNKILPWLNKKEASGLVLLHGSSGSGKTHYIRYLVKSITNEAEKYLIYIPDDMIYDLSNPTLIPLLVSHRNSLLIIEDVEGSLSRSCTSSQSVSNQLNLSDGLLSDGIQVQILATFNCPLTSLDSALLRPGRLIVQYCFPSTLNIEDARYLAESVGVSKIDQINEPLSLANIYVIKDENIEDEATSSYCHKCSVCKHYDDGEEE